MAFCTECGTMIPDNSTVCPNCGKVKAGRNVAYDAGPVQNQGDSYYDPNIAQRSQIARNNIQGYNAKPRLPFVLADGEIIVREYECSKTFMGLFNLKVLT